MIYTISKNGFNFIKAYEGYSSKPYICPAGYMTIGYGHVLQTNSVEEISHDDALELLRKDIEKAEFALYRLIKVSLMQHQFDMLVSFLFNLGSGALQRSSLRAKVNRGEHEQVPAEFTKWIYAGGIKLPGLIRRRAAESRIYEDGY